jgi:NhaP-type Na+/H+ or K+/H+ antiporter
VLAILYLSVIRMLPIWLSLAGSGLKSYEKIFLGWFGPRGEASILFALLFLERFHIPGDDEILACVSTGGCGKIRYCKSKPDISSNVTPPRQ